MMFTAPAYLFGLLAIPLVWVLLLFSMRRKRTVFGSILLLQKVAGNKIPTGLSRKPAWLLFVLYSLLVAVLTLNMAGWQWNTGIRNGVVWNFYIDDSIRMAARPNGTALWEDAAEDLLPWLQERPQVDIANLYFSSGHTELNIPIGNLQDKNRLIETLSSRLHGMVFSEKHWSPRSQSEIYIGADSVAAARFPYRIQPVEQAKNAGIVSFEIHQNGGSGFRCFFSVQNFSSQPMTVSWQLSSGAVLLDEGKDIQLSPGEVHDFINSYPIPSQAILLALHPDDDFPYDNTALAEPGHKPIVAVDCGALDDVIMRALAAADITALQRGDPGFDNCEYAIGSHSMNAKHEILFYAGDPIQGILDENIAAATTVHYAAMVEEKWRRLRMDEIHLQHLNRFKITGEWQSLLVNQDGGPALVTNGRHVIVLFDTGASDWLSHPSFPLFLSTFFRSFNTGLDNWMVHRLDESASIPEVGGPTGVQSKAGQVLNLLSPKLSEVPWGLEAKLSRANDDASRSNTETATEKQVPGLLWLGFLLLMTACVVDSKR